MVKIKGPSGVEVDVPAMTASGLVDGGHAKYVDEAEEAKAEAAAPQPVPQAGDTPPVDPQTGEPVAAAEVAGSGGEPSGDPAGDGEPSGAAEKPSDLPAGNAKRADWVAFALEHGKTEDDLQGLKQGEIRALFDPTVKTGE